MVAHLIFNRLSYRSELICRHKNPNTTARDVITATNLGSDMFSKTARARGRFSGIFRRRETNTGSEERETRNVKTQKNKKYKKGFELI